MFVDPSVPLTWPPANYVDPERHGSAGVVVECFLLSLVTFLLLIRIYTRQRISKRVGWDDVLILAAYLPAVAFTSVGLYGHFNLDWTLHVWDSRLESGITSLKFSLAAQILFATATSLTKLSTLALTYRLTTAGSSRIRYVVIGVCVMTAVDTVAFTFVTIFSCNPVSDFWTLSFTPQNCIDESAHLVSGSVINTFMDFLIVLLPIPVVTRLSLPRRQLIIVSILFAGGILASLAGAVRTYFTYLFISSANKDLTWYAYYVILTGAVELYVGIICASIPATKPFFARYTPQLIQSLPSRARGSTTTSSNSTKATSISIMKNTISEINLTPSPMVHSIVRVPNLNKELPKFPSRSSIPFDDYFSKYRLQPPRGGNENPQATAWRGPESLGPAWLDV